MFKNKIYINTLKIKQHFKKKIYINTLKIKQHLKKKKINKKKKAKGGQTIPTIGSCSRITLKYLRVADQTHRG
jgi:hypothetical protein